MGCFQVKYDSRAVIYDRRAVIDDDRTFIRLATGVCMPQVRQILLEKCNISKSPKKLPNIWANFKVTFVAKNFKKSPNLVTLQSQL